MTLPAAGTCFHEQIWANPQGVRFDFAETWRDLFLRTAGRVMTLPYGRGGKLKFVSFYRTFANRRGDCPCLSS